MNEQLNYLVSRAVAGAMSRREFVGRAGALGITAATASTLFASAARAQEPKKGGLLRAGMAGGESTNSLDPALAASEVPFAVNMTWGEMLVDVNAQGEIDYRIA
jgi:peptide/nickel transport system substrate-binding protein